MIWTLCIDGKKGALQVGFCYHPASYYAEECCVCRKTPLYRVGKDAYCKDHRQMAVEHRQRMQPIFDHKRAVARARFINRRTEMKTRKSL